MQGPNPDENSVFELKQLVVKGELYAIISAGKSAFRQAEWDKAIASYDQAITLLEDNRELLKQTNTDENKKKLARILLQASVIRDQQSAARFLKEGQYDKALEKLRAIINSVSSSDFNNEQLFIAAVEEARLSIEQTESDRQLSDKTRYLEDNFEDLFTRHYSGSPPESLTERTVVFEKQDGELLLFRLQCVDVAHGRPLQLVMKYAYDQKTGSWRFYSDAN
jgi:tetratricopeptide (TPR) repeat protein